MQRKKEKKGKSSSLYYMYTPSQLVRSAEDGTRNRVEKERKKKKKPNLHISVRPVNGEKKKREKEGSGCGGRVRRGRVGKKANRNTKGKRT